MQRRRLLIAPLATLAAVVAAATPQPARAQPPAPRLARIGWLGWTGDASGRPNAVLRAFRDGMAGFGWREGDNLHIETRAGERDFANKLLRGARPADLPVEQPARFEFVVNRRAAPAIGLVLPRRLLVCADEVIE